jgi:hypothetical protein
MSDNDLPPNHETLLYRCKPFIVPGLTNMGEIPEEYAVFDLPDEGSILYGGCIIFGRYNGKWHANASARALVKNLLSELERFKKLNDDKFNTIQAYCHAASEDKEMIKNLLEALKGTTRILEAARYTIGFGRHQLDRLEAAKEAIAKAEGYAK